MDFKYPYTDYHELNLDWFLSEFKNLVEIWARTQQDWISMQQYIRDYFDNLNVQTEIDNKIEAMIQDGTFGAIVEPFVTAALPAMVAGQLPDVVAAQIGAVVAAQIDAVVAGQLPAVAATAAAAEVGAWLAEHIDPDSGYVIDNTLTVSMAAADAKVAGTLIRENDSNIKNILEDDNVYNSNELIFEMGSIHGQSYGNHGTSNNTAFSLVKVNSYDMVVFDNSIYKIAFVGYLNNNNYYNMTGWITNSPIDIPTAMVSGSDFCCIEFRKQDESALSASDLTAIQVMLQNVYANNIIYSPEVRSSEISYYINDWRVGTNRGAFPAWSGGNGTVMTTKNAIHVEPGFLISPESGWSFVITRSDGTNIRYNDDFAPTYTDDVWIEVNKTDYSSISVHDHPIRITVNYRTSLKCYVDDATGSDSNAGTQALPFKTISKAVSSGFRDIYVKAGTYAERVDLRFISDDISIQLWEMPSYNSNIPEVPKIVIDGGNTRTNGILAQNSGRITLSDVHCKNTTNSAFYMVNCQYVKCVRCIASDTPSSIMGFELTNINGEFIDCLAYDIGRDGFNIHGYGDTSFINCVAHDCGDDGISHHDGCTGHIIGGEYYDCVKGGIASPTYGAYIDVDGVYCHNNNYGILAASTDSSRRKSYSRICNSVLKNNAIKDVSISRTDGLGWNIIYDTISIDSDSSFTII